MKRIKYLIFILAGFMLIAAGIFIKTYWIPARYAIEEEDFEKYRPYIIVQEVHYTGTGWVQVGDESGYFSSEAYLDVDLVNGNILPLMSMYDEDYANKFLCTVEYVGKVTHDAFEDEIDSYYIVEWYPIYPVLRNTILPGWMFPKGFMTNNDMSTDSDLNRQNIGIGATAEEYEQFEELFREYQDHMQVIKDELAASLGEVDYLIVFDEERISPISGRFLRDCVKIAYSNNIFVSAGNDDITKILNENTVLIEEFSFLENEGVISSINQLSLTQNMPAVLFYVNTKFTPFIISNNGVENNFAFIENADCEKYGYKNIEGNWYMWISPPPE